MDIDFELVTLALPHIRIEKKATCLSGGACSDGLQNLIRLQIFLDVEDSDPRVRHLVSADDAGPLVWNPWSSLRG